MPSSPPGGGTSETNINSENFKWLITAKVSQRQNRASRAPKRDDETDVTVVANVFDDKLNYYRC